MFVLNDPLPAIVIQDKEMDLVMGGPVRAIPQSTLCFNIEYTKWDKIDIKGPKTLG
jgi:hypothetical protein